MTDQSHLSGWDVFRLNAPDLTRRAITTVRASFALLGVLALGLGIALLAWPGKTITALAVILGAYLLVEGVIRIVMALVTPLIHAGSRLLSILFGVLFILGGVVMMRNPGLSGETLLVVVAIIIGVAWIMEGVLALLESGQCPVTGLGHRLRHHLAAGRHHRAGDARLVGRDAHGVHRRLDGGDGHRRAGACLHLRSGGAARPALRRRDVVTCRWGRVGHRYRYPARPHPAPDCGMSSRQAPGGPQNRPSWPFGGA